MRTTALPRILALGVLAHDHPVELGGSNVAQRACDAWQKADRADIGILVEWLADREPEPPQADMIRHVGRTHRTEVDRVERAQQLVAAGRHHGTLAPVALRAPVEPLDLEREPAIARGASRQHLEPGLDHLGPDAIARDGRDPICAHAAHSRQAACAFSPAT